MSINQPSDPPIMLILVIIAIHFSLVRLAYGLGATISLGMLLPF